MSSKSETGLTRLLRTALSFILAVIITILGMSICANTCILNSSNIENRFVSNEYTNAVRDDILSYTKSEYAKNGLDYSNIDSIITYDEVNQVASAYTGYYISNRVGYDENSYLAEIDEIMTEIKSDISQQLAVSDQSSNSDALNTMSASIADYFADIVGITGVDELRTVLNVGIPATYVVIGVSAFFFIFITLILAYLGEKRYRSFRAISISFFTSGVFEICLAVIVYIISQVKKLDIYPTYFGDQVLSYIKLCISWVVIFGLATILISLAVSVFTWRSKVKGKR